MVVVAVMSHTLCPRHAKSGAARAPPFAWSRPGDSEPPDLEPSRHRASVQTPIRLRYDPDAYIFSIAYAPHLVAHAGTRAAVVPGIDMPHRGAPATLPDHCRRVLIAIPVTLCRNPLERGFAVVFSAAAIHRHHRRVTSSLGVLDVFGRLRVLRHANINVARRRAAAAAVEQQRAYDEQNFECLHRSSCEDALKIILVSELFLGQEHQVPQVEFQLIKSSSRVTVQSNRRARTPELPIRPPRALHRERKPRCTFSCRAMQVWRTPRPNDSLGHTNNLFAPSPPLSPGRDATKRGSARQADPDRHRR